MPNLNSHNFPLHLHPFTTASATLKLNSKIQMGYFTMV